MILFLVTRTLKTNPLPLSSPTTRLLSAEATGTVKLGRLLELTLRVGPRTAIKVIIPTENHLGNCGLWWLSLIFVVASIDESFGVASKGLKADDISSTPPSDLVELLGWEAVSWGANADATDEEAMMAAPKTRGVVENSFIVLLLAVGTVLVVYSPGVTSKGYKRGNRYYCGGHLVQIDEERAVRHGSSSWASSLLRESIKSKSMERDDAWIHYYSTS